MSKNYFGIIDSRNTKYQGSILNGKFQGIGALIDDLYLYTLSTWKNNQINGPTFIAFPSHELFFGQIKSKKTVGKCCFQINQKQKIVFENNADRQSPMKMAYVISGQSIHFVQKKNGISSVIDTLTINNQQNELKGLKQYFGSEIQKQNIDFRYFLKQIAKNNSVVQLSGSRKQTFLGFQKTVSIGIKLQQNSIKSIGNYSQFPRFLQFGRKIVKNSPPNVKIQEGRFSEPQKIVNFNANTRPIQALKLTEQYFKQSTNFKNQFTKLDAIDNLYKQMKKMQRQCQQITTMKFGQILLQSSPKAIQGETVTKQYTLDQVKKQIYKAASRKNSSRPDTNRSTNTFRQKYQLPPTATAERHVHLQQSIKRQRERSIQNQIKQFTLYQNKMEKIYEEEANIQLLSKQKLLENIQQDLRAQREYERQLIEELVRQENRNAKILHQIQNTRRIGLQNTQKKYKRFEYRKSSSPSPLKTETYQESKRKYSPAKRQDRKYFLKESKKRQQNQIPTGQIKRQVSPYQRLDTKSLIRYEKSIQNNKHVELNEQDKNYDHLMKYKERKSPYNKYSYLQNKQQTKLADQPKVTQFNVHKSYKHRQDTTNVRQNRQKQIQSKPNRQRLSPFRAGKRNYRYVD